MESLSSIHQMILQMLRKLSLSPPRQALQTDHSSLLFVQKEWWVLELNASPWDITSQIGPTSMITLTWPFKPKLIPIIGTQRWRLGYLWHLTGIRAFSKISFLVVLIIVELWGLDLVIMVQTTRFRYILVVHRHKLSIILFSIINGLTMLWAITLIVAHHLVRRKCMSMANWSRHGVKQLKLNVKLWILLTSPLLVVSV